MQSGAIIPVIITIQNDVHRPPRPISWVLKSPRIFHSLYLPYATAVMETFLHTSLPMPTLVVTAIIFLYFVYKALWYHRLSHVPGPLFLSVSSLGFLRTHLRGSPHLEVLSWTQKYGNITWEP